MSAFADIFRCPRWGAGAAKKVPRVLCLVFNRKINQMCADGLNSDINLTSAELSIIILTDMIPFDPFIK